MKSMETKEEFFKQLQTALASTGLAERGVTIEHLCSLPITSPTWEAVYRELGMIDAYGVDIYCLSRGKDRSVRVFADRDGVLHIVAARRDVADEVVKAVREGKIELHVVSANGVETESTPNDAIER